MIVSIHQPAYLPWLGYFDKIARSDIFVYLDTVQFEKNSFINRNQIKTQQGPQWLTIPVKTKGHTTTTLVTTQVDDQQPWRKKHLRAISLNYAKAEFFNNIYPKIEAQINSDEQLLSELCWQQLKFWTKELNISTPIIRSSELDIESHKSDLVLEICTKMGASTYLSGSLGRQYLIENDFHDRGIEIAYQNYSHPKYIQLGDEFIKNLSIVDYLMNNETGQSLFSDGGRSDI
jgi:hypothetical protein